MSRARKVEPAAAINAAMASFWRVGYGHLGTRQIEEETGITRFSLQTTYGGKMPLFLTALDAYLDAFEAAGKPDSRQGDLEQLALWIEARADTEQMPALAGFGCFMLNSMVEFSSNDPEVNKRTARYFGILRHDFCTALKATQEHGVVGPTFDVLRQTEVLLGAMLGLNVVVRASSDDEAGKYMATSIANLVRGWAQINPASPDLQIT